MKLNLGDKPFALKVYKVTVGGSPTAPDLDIKLRLYLKRLELLSRLRGAAKIFCLVSTSPATTNMLLESPDSIGAYLNKTSTDPAISYRLFGLPDSNQKTVDKNFKHNLVVFAKNIKIKVNRGGNHIFVFAGICNSSGVPGLLGTTSISSLDTLSLVEGGQGGINLLLYEDADMSKIYLGGAYQNRQGVWYKKGSSPGAPHGALFSKEVKNFKVEYSDSWKNIFLKNLMTTTADKINFNKKDYTSSQIMSIYRDHSRGYFSPLYGTKTANLDKDQRIVGFPMLYAFDKNNFFRDRGQFASILKNDVGLNSCFTLTSAKVFRKRKLGKNTYHPLTVRAPSLNFEQGEDVVTRDPKILSLLGSSGLMLMTAVDTDSRAHTSGIYQYGVELVFRDHTFDRLKGLLDREPHNLIGIISDLSALHSKARMKNNYDPIGDTVTNAFLATLDNTPANLKVWIIGIHKYLSALSFFCSSLEKEFGLSPEAMATRIYSLTNPYDNGPDGIQRLIKIIKALTTQIKLVVGRDIYLSTIPDDHKGTRVSKMDGYPRVIRIKHYFDEPFDSEKFRNDGFDYLSTTVADRTGDAYSPLRLISYKRLKSILSATQGAPPGSNVTNGVSLSPRYFSMDGNIKEVNSTSPDSFKDNSLVATTLLAATQCAHPRKDYAQFSILDQSNTGLPSEEIRCIRNNLQLLSLESCTVTLEEDDPSPGIFSYVNPREKQKDSDQEDAAVKMSEPSPFVVKGGKDLPLVDFMYNMQNTDSNQDYLNEISKISNHILYYLTQTDYFDKVEDKYDIPVKNITDIDVFKTKNTTISSVEAQIAGAAQQPGASSAALLSQVLLGQSSPTYKMPPQLMEYLTKLKGDVSARDIVGFYLKYGEVKNVQYCAGFSRVGGHISVSDPIWLDLTRDQLETFSVTQEPLLCRLIAPSTVFSDYRGTRSDAYDSIFVLGSGRSLPAGNRPEYISMLTPLGQNVLNEIIKLQASSVRNDNEFMFSTFRGAQIDWSANKRTLRPRKYRSGASAGSGGALYTNGGDYLLPSGKNYIGSYHIQVKSNGKAIAMTGPVHTDEAHATLQPVSKRANRDLQRSAAAAKDRLRSGLPPGTTGGSSGDY